jgi:hypothetical protein
VRREGKGGLDNAALTCVRTGRQIRSQWLLGVPVGREGVYDTVKQAIQDLIALDLERIKGELVAVRADIKAVDSRVGTLKTRG